MSSYFGFALKWSVRVPTMAWLACLLAWGAGCSVTSEKIQQWKRTQRGPDKLQAAVQNADLRAELRIEAALALADIGRVPRLKEALGKLSKVDRGAVGNGLVAQLGARIKAGVAGGTTADQLRAKDALFGVRAALTDEQRRQADVMLVTWIVGDWPNRSRGEHSAEKIVREMPPEVAGPALAASIGQDPAIVSVLAEQLRQVGRLRDRDLAATRLLKLAGSQEPIAAPTLEALGRLGTASARTYLIQLARSPSAAQGERIKALQALALDPNPSSVSPLEQLAGSAKQPNGVRGAAFQSLEAIRSETTASALARIIRSDRNETVRYRAAEAMLRCCEVAGLSKLLQSLPQGYTYRRADVVDFLEADIKGLGAKALPVLRKALESGNWIARLLAVRVLGAIGTKSDANALEKLGSDQTRLKGWAADATIGTEALAASARIRGRK